MAEIHGEGALPILGEADGRFVVRDLKLNEAINATIERVHQIKPIVCHRFLQNLGPHAPASWHVLVSQS
jgi:hypothetical protein